MTVSSSDSISDAVKALAKQISLELENINPVTTEHCSKTDSLLYVGHWQDAIPRAIWVDPELEAIDVRCWGIIRTQAMAGSAVILSLHRLLQSQLGYSKPTVSKVLFVLRLTRWISLCSELRTEAGKFKGHIYAIHDAPITITDAMYLDIAYIPFVKQQRHHQHKQINSIAKKLWQSINDSIASQHTFFDEQGPTATINKFFQQVNGQSPVNLINSSHQVNFFNLVNQPQVKNINLADEFYENPKKQRLKIDVKEVKQINPAGLYTTTTTSCSSINKKTTTTADPNKFKNKPSDSIKLIFPPDFNVSEQELARLYLKQVDLDLQQSFLDETAAQINAKRNTSKPIRNPVAYLGWLCNEQAKGNTLLTSLSIRHRDNRERKNSTEQQIRNKQQELTRMNQPTDKSTNTNNQKKQSQKTGKNPADQLRQALVLHRKLK